LRSSVTSVSTFRLCKTQSAASPYSWPRQIHTPLVINSPSCSLGPRVQQLLADTLQAPWKVGVLSVLQRRAVDQTTNGMRKKSMII